MTIDLAKEARDKGIEYFLISFVDLFGVMRAKLVPASAITDMAEEGAGFAGFAAWLDMTPADSDMFAIPDPSSLIQLPWKPNVGWLAADLYMDGKEVDHAPRNALKRVLRRASEKGYRLKHGVECEYFLISADGEGLADPSDTQCKPCYDVAALMRRYDVISEICDAMLSLGWGPYQNDHEDANGQFEMNWNYADALVTADRHAFFKYMVKSIAESHGIRATFMPKPFAELTGNGCHTHVSLWSADGETNLFADADGELGVSKLGYNFLGGIMEHATSMCAITNPTVNSYKRINAPVTNSGATWSPNIVTYGGNNRTHMVRIPDAGRIELRLADGSTNPYLLPTAIAVAGLDGIDKERDPGKRLDINVYAEPEKAKRAKKLPLNLLDAIRELKSNKTFSEGLGSETMDAYVKLKTAEWNDYATDLSNWERSHTLDC
ncbi:MAG: type III glutamate--ammonia ligase [Gemmatimonadaceae bacterium]|nr:type III glutamate--ammonia ligase [Gemmatimonadaceae bacterium]